MSKRSIFKSRVPIESIIFGIIFVVILVTLIGGLNDTAETSLEEGRKIAENSLIRATASCYAFEGIFPSTYEYLVENYGLNIDTDKYVIHYSSISPNLVPDIGVYVK